MLRADQIGGVAESECEVGEAGCVRRQAARQGVEQPQPFRRRARSQQVVRNGQEERLIRSEHPRKGRWVVDSCSPGLGDELVPIAEGGKTPKVGRNGVTIRPVGFARCTEQPASLQKIAGAVGNDNAARQPVVAIWPRCDSQEVLQGRLGGS